MIAKFIQKDMDELKAWCESGQNSFERI